MLGGGPGFPHALRVSGAGGPAEPRRRRCEQFGCQSVQIAHTDARLSGRRWHLLTPRHHNFFFTRASLAGALDRVGIELIETRYAPSLYSIGYLAHKLRTLVDSSFLSRLASSVTRSRMGDVAVPVNLHDIVTIVGRRVPTGVGSS